LALVNRAHALAATKQPSAIEKDLAAAIAVRTEEPWPVPIAQIGECEAHEFVYVMPLGLAFLPRAVQKTKPGLFDLIDDETSFLSVPEPSEPSSLA
jgi:hypothetical protein